MFLTRTCLTWAELVSVSNRVYRQREESEVSLLHTHQPQWTEHMVLSIPQGHCGVCKLACFPFEQKLHQKSLSRHYFWIGELDQGQLFSVRIIICLANIPDIKWDFNKVSLIKKLLSHVLLCRHKGRKGQKLNNIKGYLIKLALRPYSMILSDSWCRN